MLLKDKIDRLIEASMQKHDVPGLFITIVNQDGLLFNGAYGCRDRETGAAMDENTLVYTASITKAFTALSCALLVEQKKLAWDTPLLELVPSFKTADAYITKNATIVDLLSHRTGIAEFPLIGQDGVTRADVFAALKNNAPNRPFRAAWQYNNCMYAVAGHIVELLSGQAWEDFVQARIFAPLGMADSDFAFVFGWPPENRSKLYEMRDDSVAPLESPAVPVNQHDTWNPAGSVNSNAIDMSKWLAFWLGVGEPLLSKENFDMLTAPHCITEMRPDTGGEHFSTACYGLGWVTQWYKGRHAVWHNGSFGAYVSFLPEEQLGIAVVPNMNSPLGQSVTYEICDLLSKID